MLFAYIMHVTIRKNDQSCSRTHTSNAMLVRLLFLCITWFTPLSSKSKSQDEKGKYSPSENSYFINQMEHQRLVDLDLEL